MLRCLWQINQTKTLHALTMINPATSWFDMTAIKTKSADIISNKIEPIRLSKYPWPSKIIIDQGTEFMKELIQMIEKDYGITRRPITTRNPQANSILEISHQTIGNIIRTIQVNNQKLEQDDPWSIILSAVIFVM